MRSIVAFLTAAFVALAPGLAHAEQFQYTYCMASTRVGGVDRIVYSAPFPAIPETVPGEAREQSVQRQNTFAQAASLEFDAYLERTRGRSPRSRCWQIGRFLPKKANSTAAAAQEALETMSDVSRINNAGAPIVTDFVPSLARQQTGGDVPKPEARGPAGIVLSDGPTPAELAQRHAAEVAETQRRHQEQREHAEAVAQRFAAAQAAEAQRVQARADEMRRDYDRRQAACRAGDTDNCYAKVSAQ